MELTSDLIEPESERSGRGRDRGDVSRDAPQPDSLRSSDLLGFDAAGPAEADGPVEIKLAVHEDRDAPSGVAVEKEDRALGPWFGAATFERGLIGLLAASLAAHVCLVLFFALFNPKVPQPEIETPIEVVMASPKPATAPETPKAEEKSAAQAKGPGPKAAEQKAAEQKAAEQKAAEQKAAEQKAAEQRAAEQEAAEKAAERKAAEQRAAEQKAAEQKAAEQKAAEQRAAEQKAAEQKAAEQKAAEQRAAEQKAAEQKAAEQKAAEQRAAEQKAAEQRAAEQEAEQKAAEQKAAEQRAAEQEAAEQKAAEQKAAEARAAERSAGHKAAQQRAAEQKAADQKAAEQRRAGTKAASKAAAEARAAAKPAPAAQSARFDAQRGLPGGLQLPFDNGPDIFRAVAVPLPTQGGDEPMSYKLIVFGLLERAKQYPESARERSVHGSAVVSFAVDEAGELTNVSLLRSSGDADLDIESVALVARAAPFPKPPEGAQRAFAAEITFGLRPE